MQPDVLIPIVDVFLLRVSLTQDCCDGLAFQIMSLRWISRCIKSDFRISQNFWAGMSYVLKKLKTYNLLVIAITSYKIYTTVILS